MVSSASSFAQFTALLREQRYRRQFMDADRKQMALVMAVMSAGFSLAVFNDFALLKDTRVLAAALLCRLLALLALAVALFVLRGAKRPRQQDRVFAGWVGVWSILYLGVLATRYRTGERLGPLIGQGAVICALYLLGQGGPIRLRTLAACITTGGMIVFLWTTYAEISSATRLTGTSLLFAGNLGSALIARALDGQRRQRFEVEQALAVKLRELAVEKERVEAISRARAAFLAAMSHEFRTPMNAVIGLSDLVLETPLSPDNKKYVRTINESARALLALLEDILDFAKIDAQKLALSPAPFDMRKLAASVVDMMRPAAEARGLDLILDVSQDVPPGLLGDDARLRQVLVNLVSNAVKFTEHGEIILSITARAMGGENHEITVRVKDTGIGMAPSVLARLFRPFEQGDGGMTRRHGGTGLGLAISKQIIMAMGGDIHVESEPGQGSVFSFTLRFTPAVLAHEVVPGASREERRHLRILVVDDHPINREVAAARLGRLGYVVDLASDGAEAIAAVVKKDFDVVLMDLQMPGKSGIEATEQIMQKRPPDRRPHIIAMTASVFEADREACRRAGMCDFVGKPIDITQLDAVLSRVAEERGVCFPALSREALEKLQHMEVPGEPDFFTQLCQIFKTDALKRLARMGDALERGDAKVIEGEAHVLRSASATLGATEMSELCGRIELAACDGRVDEIGSWINKVMGQLEGVERMLMREVSAT